MSLCGTRVVSAVLSNSSSRTMGECSGISDELTVAGLIQSGSKLHRTTKIVLANVSFHQAVAAWLRLLLL